jgi:hypothetical protein
VRQSLPRAADVTVRQSVSLPAFLCIIRQEKQAEGMQPRLPVQFFQIVPDF